MSDEADLLEWESTVGEVSPDDPYADRDVESLPAWWREAIEEFRAHDLRPYRPPRFDDDVLKHRVVERLEAALDVTIDVCYTEHEGEGRWEVRVDREPIGEIGHRRHKDGYSVFETEAGEFARRVLEYVRSGET
jgi:hypothetical protein